MRAHFIIFIALLLWFHPAFSLNYSFLDDTAGSYFTDKDWDIFEKAQATVLDKYPNGKKLTWKNADSGAWGSMVASKASRQVGTRCRDLTMVSSANYRVGQTTLTFCKVNGVWRGV